MKTVASEFNFIVTLEMENSATLHAVVAIYSDHVNIDTMSNKIQKFSSYTSPRSHQRCAVKFNDIFGRSFNRFVD